MTLLPPSKLRPGSRNNIVRLTLVLFCLRGFLMTAEVTAARSSSGLQAFYNFSSSSNGIVKDRSGAREPLDLRIADIKVARLSDDSIVVTGNTVVRSDKAAARITSAVLRSGGFTIEAWVRPASDKQTGPARIVTLSKDSSERNFTLGQDGNRFEVRFRTTRTTANGAPTLSSPPGSLKPELTHVVYTRDRGGRARIYLNGSRVAETTVEGDTSNWKSDYRLALANELSNDRPWLGSIHLVAIYNRDLSAQEVGQHFKAGPNAQPAQVAGVEPSADERHFHTKVAPLLSKHCLECHDSATKKGGLDLSRKDTALAGGKNGRAIVPGKLEESQLWESVESDQMPDERPPLSKEEKALLRQWIESGATWPVARIDPAAYANENETGARWLRRLTVPEYIQTVRHAVGVDVAKEAREALPADLRADGFHNTAYNLNIDLGHVEAFARLAEVIVGRMNVKTFAQRFSNKRKLDGDEMKDLIAKMGQWLLRGPLNAQEINTYRGIATTVAGAGGNFEEATRYIIEAMLQSPRFIYRMENQRGDGTDWPVGDYELASRLSYILWGGPPDEELMRAAGESKLDQDEVKQQVARMLQDPRAVAQSATFIHEWLDLDRMDNLRPDAKRFPKWNPELAADMRQETLAFVEEIVWKQKRPMSELLNAQFTYATPRLAAHYGLKPATGEGLSRYELQSMPARGGLLTQGSILTVGGDDASMVTRGLFVLHDMLRGIVKDPPPGTDTTPVPSMPGLSQRIIAEKRVAEKSCGGCHSRFEPLAYGLEKFDGIGAFHEQDEHGNKLREDGAILFPGDAQPTRYNSTSQLMDLLAKSDRVRETITWKLTQFALGRPLAPADVPLLESIHQTAWKAGGTYENLITAIVMSDLVQKTRTETHQ